jgi:hypothetical protein
VARYIEFYNLDAITAEGFRVSFARRAVPQWATGIIGDFAIRGYVPDKERLKNGSFFNKEYFPYPRSGRQSRFRYRGGMAIGIAMFGLFLVVRLF